MPDLSVKVDRNDIVVSKPSSHFSVTYRREGRTLMADDVMRKLMVPGRAHCNS